MGSAFDLDLGDQSRVIGEDPLDAVVALAALGDGEIELDAAILDLAPVIRIPIDVGIIAEKGPAIARIFSAPSWAPTPLER